MVQEQKWRLANTTSQAITKINGQHQCFDGCALITVPSNEGLHTLMENVLPKQQCVILTSDACGVRSPFWESAPWKQISLIQPEVCNSRVDFASCFCKMQFLGRSLDHSLNLLLDGLNSTIIEFVKTSGKTPRALVCKLPRKETCPNGKPSSWSGVWHKLSSSITHHGTIPTHESLAERCNRETERTHPATNGNGKQLCALYFRCQKKTASICVVFWHGQRTGDQLYWAKLSSKKRIAWKHIWLCHKVGTNLVWLSKE